MENTQCLEFKAKIALVLGMKNEMKSEVKMNKARAVFINVDVNKLD